MTSDNTMIGGIVGVGVLFAATTLIRGSVTWAGNWAAVGIGLLVAATVAVPLLVAAKIKTAGVESRTRTVRIDAGEWAAAALHEAGHLSAARQAGARDLRARIYPDGTGWTSYMAPPNMPVQHDLAIDYAGGYAEGSWHACNSDLKQAKRLLRLVGWTQRDRVDREARRLAKHAVSGGRTDKYARKLERTGRW